MLAHEIEWEIRVEVVSLFVQNYKEVSFDADGAFYEVTYVEQNTAPEGNFQETYHDLKPALGEPVEERHKADGSRGLWDKKGPILATLVYTPTTDGS